jgi:hypothetical protein
VKDYPSNEEANTAGHWRVEVVIVIVLAVDRQRAA